MQMDLSEGQRSELKLLLEVAVRELSSEIAGTDLPSFRAKLRARRVELKSILEMVREPA